MIANFYNVIYANIPAALMALLVVVISAFFADPYFGAVAVYRRINAVVVMPVPAPVALSIVVFETVTTDKLAVYFIYGFFVVEFCAVVAMQVVGVQTILAYVYVFAVTIINSDNTVTMFATIIARFTVVVYTIGAIQVDANLTVSLYAKSIRTDFKRFIRTFLVFSQRYLRAHIAVVPIRITTKAASR